MKRLKSHLMLFVFATSLNGEALIAVTRSDGGVSIIVPARAAFPGETEEERLESIRLASWQPDFVSYEIIDRSSLPTDRYFRNAWKRQGQSPHITVDRGKAEEIHRANLQREEDRLIDQLLDKHRLAEIAGDQAELDRLADKINRTRNAAKNIDLSPANKPDLPALKAARPAVFDEPEP